MSRVKCFDQQEVLQKAMELFWRNGYNGTSIQDLVQHLGVNRASLYDTYGGKRQLFEKSFQLYRQINLDRVKEFLVSEPLVKTGFLKLFELSIEKSNGGNQNPGCFVVNTTTELAPHDSEITEMLANNRSEFEGLFVDYLKTGVADGQLDSSKDLTALASLLFTLYSGINVISKLEPDRKRLSTMVREGLKVLD